MTPACDPPLVRRVLLADGWHEAHCFHCERFFGDAAGVVWAESRQDDLGRQRVYWVYAPLTAVLAAEIPDGARR